MDRRIAGIEKLIDEAESPRIANVIAQIKGSGKLLPKVVAAELLKVVCSLWKSNRAYTVQRPATQVINMPRSNVLEK